MVEFHEGWYNKFVSSTNEKDILLNKIFDLIDGYPTNACLEIGLGTSPHFAKNLSQRFKEYLIVEKRSVDHPLPKGVKLVNGDWEHLELNQKFDVIIASHVIYYFKDKKKAFEKMLNHLNDDGVIFFVVNGKSSDYGPLKLAFAKILGLKYRFTYDDLIDSLKDVKYREYTVPSTISFSSYEDLFDTLRLSFDTHPKEYEDNKMNVVEYLKKNVRGSKFTIDQKIVAVTK
jgi:SAM-dependent methyltransferase